MCYCLVTKINLKCRLSRKSWNSHWIFSSSHPLRFKEFQDPKIFSKSQKSPKQQQKCEASVSVGVFHRRDSSELQTGRWLLGGVDGGGTDALLMMLMWLRRQKGIWAVQGGSHDNRMTDSSRVVEDSGREGVLHRRTPLICCQWTWLTCDGDQTSQIIFS